MGLNIDVRRAVLDFDEGTILAGRRVVVSLGVPLRDYFAITRAVAHIASLEIDSNVMPAEHLDAMHDVFQAFGDKVLIEWDISDDETGPLPPTGDGLLALPAEAANAIINAWARAVGGNPNSAGVSESGGMSEAQFATTAAL